MSSSSKKSVQRSSSLATFEPIKSGSNLASSHICDAGSGRKNLKDNVCLEFYRNGGCQDHYTSSHKS